MSQRFVEALERFVATHGIDLVTFKKGQRKAGVFASDRLRPTPS